MEQEKENQDYIMTVFIYNIYIQSNLRTTAMHGDEPFGLCREFDLISEFFGLDEDLVDPE